MVINLYIAIVLIILIPACERLLSAMYPHHYLCLAILLLVCLRTVLFSTCSYWSFDLDFLNKLEGWRPLCLFIVHLAILFWKIPGLSFSPVHLLLNAYHIHYTAPTPFPFRLCFSQPSGSSHNTELRNHASSRCPPCRPHCCLCHPPVPSQQSSGTCCPGHSLFSKLTFMTLLFPVPI